VLFWQTAVVAGEIAPGIPGKDEIMAASVWFVPVPQAFDGVTVIFPDMAPTVTVTEFVFCPAVIVQSAGNAHVNVTPATFVTL
jgi:hypothetical protein